MKRHAELIEEIQSAKRMYTQHQDTLAGNEQTIAIYENIIMPFVTLLDYIEMRIKEEG